MGPAVLATIDLPFKIHNKQPPHPRRQILTQKSVDLQYQQGEEIQNPDWLKSKNRRFLLLQGERMETEWLILMFWIWLIGLATSLFFASNNVVVGAAAACFTRNVDREEKRRKAIYISPLDYLFLLKWNLTRRVLYGSFPLLLSFSLYNEEAFRISAKNAVGT